MCNDEYITELESIITELLDFIWTLNHYHEERGYILENWGAYQSLSDSAKEWLQQHFVELGYDGSF